MKLTRKMLLIIVASLGALLILYSVFRQLTGIGLNETAEKYMMDIIIFSALGIFLYNRKLAKDEKQAKEAAEETEETVPADDEDKPHWERNKVFIDE